MSNPYFSFKQFTVFHHRCAMKVGIDGVLIGAWANVNQCKNILDIGTGTGLIALMIAQRTNAKIHAIDIDNDAILQVNENIDKSPWKSRVHTSLTSLQDFALNNNEKYDLIVSNPPYFVNSTKTPSESRNAARHTDTLTHQELITNSKTLLTLNGRLCIILPFHEGLRCIDIAMEHGLYCTKMVNVYPKPNVEIKRLLLEFSQSNTERIVSNLTIESTIRHHYSDEFTALAKDYYLKL